MTARIPHSQLHGESRHTFTQPPQPHQLALVASGQLDPQQGRGAPLQALLFCEVSSAHRYIIYMDRLQDYFPPYCKQPDSYSLFFHPVTPRLVDCLRLCDGTCTITLQPTRMLDMDMVTSTLVQRIQPGAKLRRGQSQSSLASSPIGANNGVAGRCPTLGRRRVVSVLVVDLRSRTHSDDHGPRCHDVHL